MRQTFTNQNKTAVTNNAGDGGGNGNNLFEDSLLEESMLKKIPLVK